ncbi:MAG: hypothetical protein H6Q86_1877 [candidate division NC10 bacterium]|jgi:hypothetical protein|nr:hypothetical protein [candidate division NC10 bacterium]
MEPQDLDDITLVSKDEAIAEVRRWLETENVDPERVFTQMGDQVIRYKDLVACLEQDTPDGKLLRFAISRGRVMKSERSRALRQLLDIAPPPAGAGPQADPAPSENTTPSA